MIHDRDEVAGPYTTASGKLWSWDAPEAKHMERGGTFLSEANDGLSRRLLAAKPRQAMVLGHFFIPNIKWFCP
jgi:hypothetical protein